MNNYMFYFSPPPRTKADVLQCLTYEIETGMLEDRQIRVSDKCRAELKFELLQKHSSIKFDPVLVCKCYQLKTFHFSV